MQTGLKKYKFKNEAAFYVMLSIPVLLLLIYYYGPMFGMVMAFQDFNVAQGFLKSEWTGLENFKYVISMEESFRALWNTLYISFFKVIFGLLIPIAVSLILNEVKKSSFRKAIQTSIYLPYFLSWAILGGIFLDILSLSGPINELLQKLGISPIFFLGDNNWFPWVLIFTDVLKNFGFATVVYIAAMTGIDPTFYEAAKVDGAAKLRQMWHITLPAIAPIIIVMTTLAIGNILNLGIDQVFTLYSPIVYKSGDIIDTFVYRMGLVQAQFGPAAAVGLFKSVVSFLFVSLSYYFAYKVADYRIF